MKNIFTENVAIALEEKNNVSLQFLFEDQFDVFKDEKDEEENTSNDADQTAETPDAQPAPETPDSTDPTVSGDPDSTEPAVPKRIVNLMTNKKNRQEKK